MFAIKWIVIVAVVGYASLIAMLYWMQGRMMYPAPQKTRTSPADADFPQAEEIVLDTEDGAKIIVWHVPPKGDKPVVLFFHGNGEVLAWRVPRFRALTVDGTGLIALSYRSYGGSTGQPSETALLSDGEATYRFAAKHYPPERIVPWGYSLGSGVAVAVAGKHPVGKLILEAPYTSTADVAAASFPFVPVRWLLRDQFHSDERITQVKAPVLIMHGEKDSVVAMRFGERLYELTPGRKRLMRFPLGTHINLDELGAVDAVHAFLAEPN